VGLISSRALFIAAASLTLLTPACSNTGLHGLPVRPKQQAPEISAEDTGGGSFALHDQRGHVVVLSFGYTSCPDVCPTTLSRMKEVNRRLAQARAADVTMLFLTVDPERDTVARLRDYVRAFDPKIHGLRLTGVPLSSTLHAYGVTSERHELPANRYEGRPLEGAYYSFDHTSGYYVIDRAGALRLRFPADAPVDDMVSDLLALNAEDEPR
jgi:protein SCO1/2